MKDRFPQDFLADDKDIDKQLILEPDDKLTRKRPISLVNIDKDNSRKPEYIDHEDIPNNFITYNGIQPMDPSEPKVKIRDFGKDNDRFKKQGLIDDETKEELILHPDAPKPKKPVSNFGKAEKRFRPPKVPDDPWHNEQPITDIIKNRDQYDREVRENKEGHFFERNEKLKFNEREEKKQKKYDKKQFKKWVF